MPKMLIEKINLLKQLTTDYIKARPGYALVEDAPSTGGSAAVFKVSTPQGIRAIKVYDPHFFSDNNRAAEFHRIELQRRVSETAIPTVIEIFHFSEQRGTCFIEMEFCPWPELKKQLASVPDERV